MFNYKPDNEELEIVNPIENNIFVGFYNIPNDNNFIISKDGICISLNTGKILSNRINSRGYRAFSTDINGKSYTKKIHRLLAITFVGRPKRHWDKPFNKLEVNHIDGNKSNNALSNLEWCTGKENKHHALKIGLTKSKRVLSRNILTNEINSYPSLNVLARHFKIEKTTLRRRLETKEASVRIKNNCVFKYDDGSDWIEIPKENHRNNNWETRIDAWIATNKETKLTVIADTLKDLSIFINVNYETMIKNIYRDSGVMRNWIIEKNGTPN